MTHEELLSLPLFLGLAKDETAALRAEKLITERLTKKNLFVVKAGERCNFLMMLVSGSALCTTVSDDGSYTVEELLHAPLVIEPSRLFGLSQRFASSYKTTTQATLLMMDKQNVVKFMGESLVFRTNYLNMVSAHLHKNLQRQWQPWSDDIEKRIVKFIKDHCSYPAGYKVIHIQMNTMARELGCSRLEISQALHKLEEKEKIVIKRERIVVPMAELLAV